MSGKKLVLLLTAALFAATLWGCGSNRDSGDSVVPEGGDPAVVDAQVVGIDNCAQCHATYNDAWLNGSHGNANARPGGPHVGDSSCQPCHNQLEQAALMPSAFPGEPVRDIVACESCHGGGSAHRGIGPIPTVRPDWEQCVQCHDHAEGVRHADSFGMLASNVGASAHNNSDDLHASSTKCQRCHSVEGSIRFAAYTGDKNVMNVLNDEEDPVDLEENLHPVTCSACHVPHTDALRADTAIELDYTLNEDTVDEQDYTGAWDPNGNGAPDQFDFCTSCHTYYNQDGVLIGSGSEESGTAPFYHNTAWYRTVTSTHYDNPATSYESAHLPETDPNFKPSVIEGYVVRANSANPCFDCHGHELRTNTRRSRDVAGPDDNPLDYGSTIHTQWASSGHAGELLKAKYAAADATESRTAEQVDAVMAAGAQDVKVGDAWAHYDWDSASRQSCQKCHTSSGVSNFMDSVEDGIAYDATTNDFSHLDPNQNELLYCWGCHSNAQTGVMRTTAAIPLDYTVDGEAVSLTAADEGQSAACLSCHSGRGNVNTLLNGKVTADIDPTATTGYRTGGTSTHYMTAGAIINQAQTKVGYTYGLDYTDSGSFLDHGHVTLGCADCHMTSSESHTFEVVEKDDTGAIVAINSTKCADCHAGNYELTADELEMEAEGYHEALEILAEDLVAAGTPPQAGYPYFSGTPANEGHSGAMHNYSLLHHEPGAYAHNRYYAKRLIFDSIDWLDGDTDSDGNNLDGTITIDVATYPEAAHWLGADATTGVASRP